MLSISAGLIFALLYLTYRVKRLYKCIQTENFCVDLKTEDKHFFMFQNFHNSLTGVEIVFFCHANQTSAIPLEEQTKEIHHDGDIHLHYFDGV